MTIATRIVVAPQRWLDPDHKDFRPGMSSYAKGGKYLNASTGDDLTGWTFSGGSITTITAKPEMIVQRDQVGAMTGRKVHANLFRRSAGWRWLDGDNALPTLVSVETAGKHYYSPSVYFDAPVTLWRNAAKATEPRLRPFSYGDVLGSRVIGRISVRGREHPVYERIMVTAPL